MKNSEKKKKNDLKQKKNQVEETKKIKITILLTQYHHFSTF